LPAYRQKTVGRYAINAKSPKGIIVMGIFDKLFGALKKTKDGFGTRLRMLFAKNKLGDEFYEELEELLIESDVSVSTAEEVVERVKERAIAEKLKDGDYVVSLLREVLIDILEESEVEAPQYPCVIMLVGVNGVGKTTTVGKLAHYFLSKG
jgi:fused signal recognition particle receptor